MILSLEDLLSDKQAITATAASTNVLDLGATGVTYDNVSLQQRIARGRHYPFLVQVTEDFDNLTSLTIALQQDDNEAFSSPSEVYSFVVPLADLVAGYKIPFDKLPRNITERYIRMNYTVTGTAPTQGRITSGIVVAVDEAYQG